jgi:hypothetical protein
VLDLKSRRVQVVGSTSNPDAAFMAQAARRLTDAVDGVLASHRILSFAKTSSARQMIDLFVPSGHNRGS